MGLLGDSVLEGWLDKGMPVLECDSKNQISSIENSRAS